MHRRERCISRFSVAIFLCHSFENLHWEPIVVSENFRQGKYFMKARGDITFSHLIFLVSHYRKLSLGTFRSFKNFRLAKFLHGRERGKSRFSVAFFLYHSFEKLHSEPIVISENFWHGKIFHECEGGNHVFPSSFPRFILPKTSFGNSSVFQKLSVSEKKRNEERGAYHVFPSHFFCITVSKIFIDNPSLFQKTSSSEYILWIQGGISRLPVELFQLYITENFHWELFVVANYLWQRKDCIDEGRVYDVFFRRKIFESQYRKLLLGIPRGFRNFLVWEETYDEDGGISNFRQTFFVS